VKDRCEDEIPLKRTARQAAGRPKKAAAPPPPRIPRITRLMALAIKFQDMIDRGEVKDYADWRGWASSPGPGHADHEPAQSCTADPGSALVPE
jgi:hypothetical protein